MEHCQNSLLESIRDQTRRSLWSLENLLNCVPEDVWSREYCGMPLWKHLYHTLHSLDRWYINPFVYEEPSFHLPDLANLDAVSDGYLTRDELLAYLDNIKQKLQTYLTDLRDEQLTGTPAGSDWHRLHLILAQHRHLDMHIGMVMGFLIADEGKWPKIMGIDTDLNDPPQGDFF